MTRRRSPLQADLLAELPPISYVWETPYRRPRRAEWDTPLFSEGHLRRMEGTPNST